jgi:Flp pilus assembly protein TadG
MTAKRVTNGRFDRFRSESGISLIHVAMLLFVFMGFSMFVIDYGVLWLARVQAQNAADSGALAGAIARGFDELADPPAANGAAYQSAVAAATKHGVLAEIASPTVSFVCPAWAPAGVRCTRVDVWRDGSNGSTTLPTFFAQAFGNFSQQIKATATAWTTSGNSTKCVRPWAIADKWTEDPATTPNEYNHWVKVGNTVVELNPHDTYTPPSSGSSGTGYTVSPPAPPPGDQGTRITLKLGSAGDVMSPGWFMAVDLPDGMGGYPSGANDYRDNIGTCVGISVGLGDKLPTETGDMVGPTRQGVDDLLMKDPDAYWNGSQIADSLFPEFSSPRVVPVVVFNIDEFQQHDAANDWGTSGYGCPTGGGCVKVVNLLGFFVESMSGRDVTGILLTYPGEFDSSKNIINNSASFSTVIQLIQ